LPRATRSGGPSATVLRTTLGNKSRSAKVLSTDYKTLHVKMKQLGIRASDLNQVDTAVGLTTPRI